MWGLGNLQIKNSHPRQSHILTALQVLDPLAPQGPCLISGPPLCSERLPGLLSSPSQLPKRESQGGRRKMAEEQDGETTFSPTNSSKEQLNGEQSSQNNF